jgi:hypothetical protein
MALIMEIMKTIAGPVQELVFWLNETYQVDTQETFNKWRELTGMNIQVTDEDNSDEPIQVSKAAKKSKSAKIPKVKNACCQHVFANGNRAGEQCSTKPKNGAEYCSAHRSKPKKSENSDDETTPKKPKSKKKVDDAYASDVEETKKPKSKKKNIDLDDILPEKKPSKKKTVRSSIDEDDSDAEETVKKPKTKKNDESKKVGKKPKKENKKKVGSSDEHDEHDGSEPETRVKPLLKKKGDEEDIIDDELDF